MRHNYNWKKGDTSKDVSKTAVARPKKGKTDNPFRFFRLEGEQAIKAGLRLEDKEATDKIKEAILKQATKLFDTRTEKSLKYQLSGVFSMLKRNLEQKLI